VNSTSAVTSHATSERERFPLCAGPREPFDSPGGFAVDIARLLSCMSGAPWRTITSSVTGSDRVWVSDEHEEVSTTVASQKALWVSDLGWSETEASETRGRFRSFEEDWEAPGMEAYDEM